MRHTRFVRISSLRIRINEPLPWNVRDRNGTLLLARESVVQNQEQLDALWAHDLFVDIAEIQAEYRRLHQSSREAPTHEQLIFSTIKPARSIFHLWNEAFEEMHRLMSGLPDVLPAPGRIEDLSAHLVELVDKHADIALYHLVRQEANHLYYYGYHHSIHTAVLSLLMMRKSGRSRAKTMSLMKAALTMNMPILQLQGEMAMQETPLTDQQHAQIHAHPEQSVEWLRKSGVTDPDWLLTVAQHHERPDGTGYPHELRDVSELAVALRVADVFMSKISRRKLRTRLPIQEALRQLYREDGGGLLSSAVVKAFGIYPPGELVRLANGEIGVVAHLTDNVRYPIVSVITDTAGRPIAHTLQRDTSEKEFAVMRSVADKSLVARLPAERIYGYGHAEVGDETMPAPESGPDPVAYDEKN